MDMLGTFSVIIPTMQRSRELRDILIQCSAHPLVHEILVINNVAQPLTDLPAKVRVLQQDENIGVNPAWNLGASEATGEFLAILNDDIAFEDEILAYGRDLLVRGWGMVGPELSCLNTTSDRPIGHRIASGVGMPFGTFMMLKRENYVPVPEGMVIWAGDDWLMAVQKRPSAALINTSLFTEMSATSSDSEFQQRMADEHQVLGHLLAQRENRRAWHLGIKPLRKFRRAKGRLQRALAR